MSGIEELKLVPQFREVVSDDIASCRSSDGTEIPDDIVSEFRCARFINAYNGNITEAAKAFREMLHWRKENRIDELRKHHISNMSELRQESMPYYDIVQKAGEYGPWLNAGRCNKGDIVHLECIGMHDPSLVVDTVTPERITDYQIGIMEVRLNVLDCQSRLENRLVRSLQIRDLSRFGINILQHTRAMNLISETMKIGSAYYPETTRKSIFINTPMTFYSFWKVAGGMLREKTQKKIIFLKQEYHRDLLKYVDALTIHRMDKMIMLDDHSFIARGAAEDDIPLSYSKKVTVSAGSTSYFPIFMKRTGARSVLELRLSPETVGDGLPPFSLSFLTNSYSKEGERNEAFNETQLLAKIYATEDPNKWTIRFPQELEERMNEGFLIVTFDNRASWMFSVSILVEAKFVELA